MKRILIVLVLTTLACSTGCRICDWFKRGPAYQQCPQAVTYATPVPTISGCTVNACDPCSTGGMAPVSVQQ